MWELKYHIVFELDDGTEVIRHSSSVVEVETEKESVEWLEDQYENSDDPLVDMEGLFGKIRAETLEIDECSKIVDGYFGDLWSTGCSKVRGWGRGMKWTPYRQRLLSHGAIYDVKGETPKYFFKRNDDDTYKETTEYEVWLDLLKRQDKRDKKIISKLRNTRIHK